MSGTDDRRPVTDFLEALGRALNEVAAIPDFADMFAGGEERGGRPVIASPDEIELALVLGLQRAETARRELEQGQRAEAQWDVAAYLVGRNEALPPLPDAAALEIVDPDRRPDLTALSGTAGRAVQAVVTARGAPDAEFEEVTRAAAEALDARDDAVTTLEKELAAELDRRRDAVQAVEHELAGARAPVKGTLAELLGAQRLSPTLKVLANQLRLATDASAVLPDLVAAALPGDFAAAVEAAREAIAPIGNCILATTGVVQAEKQKDRKSFLAHLPTEAPGLPANAGSLAAPEAVQAARDAVAGWNAAAKAVRALKPAATDEEFERLYAEAVDGFVVAQERVGTLGEQVRKEAESRAEVIAGHRRALGEVTEPKNLASGTAEHTAFADAEKTARDALGKLDRGRSGLDPKAFADAGYALAKAVTAFRNVAAEAGTLAGERVNRALQLRRDTRAAAKVKIDDLSAVFDNFAVAGLRKLVVDALAKPAKEVDLIRGVDEDADAAIVYRVAQMGAGAEAMRRVITNFPAAHYAAVVDNAEMKQMVQAVRDRLASCGLDPEAAELLAKVGNKAVVISDKYDRLDDLEGPVATALQNRQHAPKAAKVLDKYEDVVEARDGQGAGDLQKQINDLTNAIGAIDYAVSEIDDKADEAARPAFDQSQCKTFIDQWGNGNVVARLETLIAANAVRVGTKLKAYQSNDDRPKRFSVEADIRIDGYTRVVLHCHCDSNGAPLSGNACHFKLSAEKYDVGVSYELSGALRGALLPPQRRCYEAGQKGGFVA